MAADVKFDHGLHPGEYARLNGHFPPSVLWSGWTRNPEPGTLWPFGLNQRVNTNGRNEVARDRFNFATISQHAEGRDDQPELAWKTTSGNSSRRPAEENLVG